MSRVGCLRAYWLTEKQQRQTGPQWGCDGEIIVTHSFMVQQQIYFIIWAVRETQPVPRACSQTNNKNLNWKTIIWSHILSLYPSHFCPVIFGEWGNWGLHWETKRANIHEKCPQSPLIILKNYKDTQSLTHLSEIITRSKYSLLYILVNIV